MVEAIPPMKDGVDVGLRGVHVDQAVHRFALGERHGIEAQHVDGCLVACPRKLNAFRFALPPLEGQDVRVQLIGLFVQQPRQPDQGPRSFCLVNAQVFAPRSSQATPDGHLLWKEESETFPCKNSSKPTRILGKPWCGTNTFEGHSPAKVTCSCHGDSMGPGTTNT